MKSVHAERRLTRQVFVLEMFQVHHTSARLTLVNQVDVRTAGEIFPDRFLQNGSLPGGSEALLHSFLGHKLTFRLTYSLTSIGE